MGAEHSAKRPNKGCGRCRRWRRRAEKLEKENRKLHRHSRCLERQLEQALRAGKRQAAPFSKGAPKANPLKPGRRAGRAYGTRARRVIPDHFDETIEVPLPPCCPHCSGKVEKEKVVHQYQTDIPKVRPHVTHFQIDWGRCCDCKRPVRGRHPRQTSSAVGAAASQLGPRAVGLAADLNKRLGVPYEKIVSLYQVAFGLAVSRAGLCLALQRLSRAAEPTYHELIGCVRQARVVSPDETGWKVAGELAWLWVFVSARVTVYAIQPGRGFEEAAAILSPEFSGVLERDGWAPYRRFVHAEHQSCLAHLLRRCDNLIEFAQRGQARFPHAVRRILLASLELEGRIDAGEISPHGLAVARGRLEARLDRTLSGAITHPPNRRFLRHLTTEREHLFTFLGREDIEATNWKAEHAIRPAVVTRKVCGGNRSWVGAQTQQILATVLRTCQQQKRDALGLFVEMLQHAPTVGPLLAPRPP